MRLMKPVEKWALVDTRGDMQDLSSNKTLLERLPHRCCGPEGSRVPKLCRVARVRITEITDKPK